MTCPECGAKMNIGKIKNTYYCDQCDTYVDKNFFKNTSSTIKDKSLYKYYKK